jgi:hypothetical protein
MMLERLMAGVTVPDDGLDRPKLSKAATEESRQPLQAGFTEGAFPQDDALGY